MKTLETIISVVLVLTLLAGVALADWQVGDGHKMHFPQLPDPNGWDVDFTTPKLLADDWKCSETGPVDDIHFWVSHQQGVIPILNGLEVKIFDNIPVVPGAVPYSRPGELLWEADLSITDIKTAPGGTGPQGWYDPYTGVATPNDHSSYFQINITDISNPFVQQEGTIYWLGISLNTSSPDGWKSSDRSTYPDPYTGSHYEDDAVWRDANGGWHELRYPSVDPLGRGGQSMDLAFVITPEPATLFVMTAAGLALLLRRR